MFSRITQQQTNFCLTVLIVTALVLYYYYYFTNIVLLSDNRRFESESDHLRIEDSPWPSIFNLNNHSSSFVEEMGSFPWIFYNDTVNKVDSNNTSTELRRQLSTLLLLKLVSFLKKEPFVPVNESCVAPPLQIPPAKHLSIFLRKPRKVGILLQFGFDVDLLEIHLQELDAVVDKFFILESVESHSSNVGRKPLMWELVKYDKRFFKFSEKVVHFLVDDVDIAKQKALDGANLWAIETLQEKVRWLKFREWNTATKYFSGDDLIGIGDADEVPNRNNVFYLKNCQFPGNESVDIGIWFPFDGMDSVYMTDFPVKGHPYTLGDPTFWTVHSAEKYYNRFKGKKYPTRKRGSSFSFLLGGMHLSRYAYPPFQIAKMLTATRAGKGSIDKIIKIGMLYAANKGSEAAKLMSGSMTRQQTMAEFKKKHGLELTNAVVKIPWFLNCNPERYPGFWKKYDFRLNGSVGGSLSWLISKING